MAISQERFENSLIEIELAALDVVNACRVERRALRDGRQPVDISVRQLREGRRLRTIPGGRQ